MRDQVLDAGITINGLPIMMKRQYGYSSDANLDIYYQDCVIGGPGSFVIAIHEREQFKEATAPSWCWRSPVARRSHALYLRN